MALVAMALLAFRGPVGERSLGRVGGEGLVGGRSFGAVPVQWAGEGGRAKASRSVPSLEADVETASEGGGRRRAGNAASSSVQLPSPANVDVGALLEFASGVRDISSSPQALEERLKQVKLDPAKAERLRAFVETYVSLPEARPAASP